MRTNATIGKFNQKSSMDVNNGWLKVTNV